MTISRPGALLAVLLLSIAFLFTAANGQEVWTSRSCPVTNSLNSVAWGNNTFVAVSTQGEIISSADGITWTMATRPASSLVAVAWGKGKFLAINASGQVFISSDGVAWGSQGKVSSSGTFASLFFGNNQFVALGSSGLVFTSQNGTDWISKNTATSVDLFGGTWGDNQFCIGTGNGKILTSPDGTTWTLQSTPAPATSIISSVAYGNGVYVAVGNNGVLTSNNGAVWTSTYNSPYPKGVIFSDNQFVIVGNAGLILTSPNGSTWTSHSISNSAILMGIAGSNSQFVAVTIDHEIFTSPFTIPLVPGTLKATIYSATTNAPIGGATIQIISGGKQSTDSNGHATISNLYAGNYSLSISAPGFVPDTDLSATIVGGQTTTATWFLAPLVPPSVPTLASPGDGADDQPSIKVFQWSTASLASSYRFQLSFSRDFSTTILDQNGLSGTNDTVSGLPYSSTLFWHVNASNSAGISAWSATWTLFTASAIPAAPVLASPSNGATGISQTPNLIWNNSEGAVTYNFQVAANSSFLTTIYNQNGLGGPMLGLYGLSAGTTYYWRGAAKNANGTSSWSTPWSFTTNPYPAPSIPALASPSNGATTLQTTIQFSWNSSANANSYNFQLSASTTFSPILFDQPGLQTKSVQITVPVNTRLYWHVNATNPSGTSGWSPTWSFVVSNTAVLSEKGLGQKPCALSNRGIDYTLPSAAPVSVVLYDLKGRIAERLVSGMQSAGRHKADFRSCPPGNYIAEFKAGTRLIREKVAVSK